MKKYISDKALYEKINRLNHKDLTYNLWHYTLPRDCYAMDIDFIEMRNIGGKLTPVAIIETKYKNAEDIKDYQREVLLSIAEKLDLPCYVVYHRIDIIKNRGDIIGFNVGSFEVLNLRTGKTKIYNPKEYENFIKNLGR